MSDERDERLAELENESDSDYDALLAEYDSLLGELAKTDKAYAGAYDANGKLHVEVLRLKAELAEARAERDEAIREWHSRELHHFEEEVLREKAEAERDALATTLARIREIEGGCEHFPKAGGWCDDCDKELFGLLNPPQ